MASDGRPPLTYYLSETDSAAWHRGGTALAQVHARLWAAYQQAGFTEPLLVLHRTGEPATVLDPHPALMTPLTLGAPLAALAPRLGWRWRPARSRWARPWT